VHRKVLIAFFVIAMSLATALSRPIQTTPKKAAVPAEVSLPFELVNRHVMIQVRVNNSRPLSFVLDTGDKYAIIDLARARELGLNLQGEVRAAGAGPERPTGAFVRGAMFTIPGLAGFSQPIDIALPVAHLASRLGQDFDGILGPMRFDANQQARTRMMFIVVEKGVASVKELVAAK